MSKKSNYYNTCKNCGANLDPNEVCDCQQEKIVNANVSETFIVTFDAIGEDLSCLQISKVTNASLKILNVYYGKEADELYNKLVNTL